MTTEGPDAAPDVGSDPWTVDWHRRCLVDAAPLVFGFFAATINLPTSPILAGLLVGLLTSIPDAIVTKAYAPILITGLLFGAIAGWIVQRKAARF